MGTGKPNSPPDSFSPFEQSPCNIATNSLELAVSTDWPWTSHDPPASSQAQNYRCVTPYSEPAPGSLWSRPTLNTPQMNWAQASWSPEAHGREPCLLGLTLHRAALAVEPKPRAVAKWFTWPVLSDIQSRWLRGRSDSLRTEFRLSLWSTPKNYLIS